jgi:condensin complex subunit 3
MVEGSDKKVLCQALNKLYLPHETDDDDKVRTLKLLVHNLRTRRPPRDASALAALVKFDGAFSKRFEKQLEDFNESEYRQLQSLQELFEFLDDIMPLDEDEDGDEDEEAPAAKKRAARKRRSESVTSDATSIMEEWAVTPPRGKSGKAKSKYDHGLHLVRGNVLIVALADDVGRRNQRTMRTRTIRSRVLLLPHCPLDRCHAEPRK